MLPSTSDSSRRPAHLPQGLEHKRQRVPWPYRASMTIRNPIWGHMTYHQREKGELQAAATVAQSESELCQDPP